MSAAAPDRQGVARRRWIIGASTLFIATMIGSTAHDLWTSRREAERQAEQEIVVLARVLAEQTRRSLQAVDVMLREIADTHAAGQLPAVGSPRLGDYLELQRRQEGDIASVFLTDAQGRLLAVSGSAPPAPEGIGRWPGFERLKGDAAATTVVEQARATPQGRWSLPLLRRLAARNHRFDGSVGALLDTRYFEHFYADAGLGEGQVVALINNDGSLVARHPRREHAVGQPVGGWALGLRASDSTPLPRRFYSHQDHVERLGVTQPVAGYALNVVVARDTGLVFAAWREAAWGSVLRTALLCAAALGLLAVVLRQLQRLEASRTSQKLEAMGTLAGGIAHDFNNILGAILGYAELAHAQAEPGSTLQQHLDGVMGAGLRAKSLVQRILAFSRSGMGERQPVHVGALVDEALDLLAATVPSGVRLERDLRVGDAALLGDPAQIHQVVMNLGTNALQASRAPGVVSVTLAPRTLAAPRRATSGNLPPGDYLELVVRDEGTGIERGQIERIFDPFFTTKAVGVGTGLGLSLVHGIVTELQGAIDVQSEPGRGSVFTVLLPWQGQTTDDPRGTQGDDSLPRGEGQRVLIVDDEAALVALGEEALAALGYEPVGYTSSEEALQAFERDPQRFDALLTDETMPTLTGSQLAAAVRRLRPELPVLLMSGYVGPAVAARAQALGVHEVLAKPLVARDIALALAGALPRGVQAGAS
jgi:signal transduction histidine kinase/ActR/RegA family two-component response regulator